MAEVNSGHSSKRLGFQDDSLDRTTLPLTGKLKMPERKCGTGKCQKRKSMEHRKFLKVSHTYISQFTRSTNEIIIIIIIIDLYSAVRS